MKLDQCPVTSDEKQPMVAEAAYFRFANRRPRGLPINKKGTPCNLPQGTKIRANRLNEPPY